MMAIMSLQPLLAMKTRSRRGRSGRAVRVVDAMPTPSLFGISAVFHYLGPSFAVLLFARVDVLGVAWLRIATAAVFFAAWRRPWQLFVTHPNRQVLVGMAWYSP